MVIDKTVIDDVWHGFDGMGGDNKNTEKKFYCLKW